MHKKLLEEHFKEYLGSDDKKNVEGAEDMKYSILSDQKGNYKVRIYHNDSSDDREFAWEKVKIEPNYGQNKIFDSDNAFSVVYQEEETEKLPLSTGWIIFLVVLTVVVVLMVVF
jgi:hypothetical protein